MLQVTKDDFLKLNSAWDPTKGNNDLFASADFGADGFISLAETISPRRPRQEDTYICEETSLETAEQAQQFLADAYNKIGEAARAKPEAREQGACAITAAITKDGKLTVANAGDSQVVIYVKNKETNEIESVQLNKLHSPSNESERIQALGGFVARGRVGGTLAVARAFGDSYLEVKGNFLIAYKPEITIFDLNPYLNDQYETFVEVSCDGVREKYSEEQVKQNLKENADKDVAKRVITETNKVSADNQTAFMIKVPTNLKELKKGLLVAVNDGHGGVDIAKFAAEEMSKRNAALDVSKLPALPTDVEFRNVEMPQDLTAGVLPKPSKPATDAEREAAAKKLSDIINSKATTTASASTSTTSASSSSASSTSASSSAAPTTTTTTTTTSQSPKSDGKLTVESLLALNAKDAEKRLKALNATELLELAENALNHAAFKDDGKLKDTVNLLGKFVRNNVDDDDDLDDRAISNSVIACIVSVIERSKAAPQPQPQKPEQSQPSQEQPQAPADNHARNYMFLKIGVCVVLAVGVVCLLRSQAASTCFNNAMNSSLGKGLSESAIGQFFSKIASSISRA